MIKNNTTIGELKKDQTFAYKGGIYKCGRPYFGQARNPAYRAAFITVVKSPVDIPAGSPVSFNHRTKVELL